MVTSVNIWEKKKRKYPQLTMLSIQILQYEFLGPIPLDDWGPPMEKLVYLILSRDKDRFNVVYVGDCEKTDDPSFFVQNEHFKCWVGESGSEKGLYLAILPKFESSSDSRESILKKIITRYKPPCNPVDDVIQKKPDYVVRTSEDIDTDPEKFLCPCCGADMKPEQILEQSTLYRCTGCGISDTKLNS